MSTERTAPGTWTYISEGDHVVAKNKDGLLQGNDENSIAVFYGPDKKVNQKFTVLADHNFDKMEAALRLFLSTYIDTDKVPTASDEVRVAVAVNGILSAIDKERGK